MLQKKGICLNVSRRQCISCQYETMTMNYGGNEKSRNSYKRHVTGPKFIFL